MSRMKIMALLAVGGLAAMVPSLAHAQPTSTNSISLQARVEGVQSGAVDLVVKFFDAATGGNQVGASIPLAGVPVVDGVVSVPASPIDPTVFNGQTRYMEIVVDGQTMSPRTLVTSVPYASRAASGGDPLGVFKINAGEQRIEVGDSLGVGPMPKFGGVLANSEKPWIRTHTKFSSGNIGDYVARFEFSDLGISDSGVQVVKKNGGNNFHLLRCYYKNNDQFVVDEDGNVWAGGDISCSVLTIRGADLAERFNVAPASSSCTPAPGLVMSIDEANPGKLRVSSTPYDKKVAGAISGAGDLSVGVVMGKDSPDPLIQGEHPVAMSGRIYVWCDATFGAIAPGDRLTTSSTPGHAMKVHDESRAPGAVIGKAMPELNKGTGLVLVLVNLQ